MDQFVINFVVMELFIAIVLKRNKKISIYDAMERATDPANATIAFVVAIAFAVFSTLNMYRL